MQRIAPVALIVWPAEADRREALASLGRPRLLVLAEGATPPELVDCMEDWVSAPVSEDELRARTDALSVRARCHHQLVPEFDDEGFLCFGAYRIHLPPVEARLAGALLERYGAVVGAARLIRAGWPESAPTRGMLDVRIHRLRRRLSPIGLSIRTVRQRGWMLEADEAAS